MEEEDQGRTNNKDTCRRHDISLNKSVEKGVSESWVGRPKGMLQVAWEKGLLELDIFYEEDFTEKGLLDGMGNMISNTSLSQFITKCSEFLKKNPSYS